MIVQNGKHSGTLESRISEREIRNGRLAEKIAEEAAVLLKNENMLPINTLMPIALLGTGAEKTVKGGVGSGDVNNRESISIYTGLKEAGVPITSESWLLDYEMRYKEARESWKDKILEEAKKVSNPFDAYAVNPFVRPEGRPIEKCDLLGAEAAIYVISRISGEGKDRKKAEGDYYLSKREKEDLQYLKQNKLPIILILNAGGPIELTDLLQENENIKAVLNISQPGQEGGRAAANLLLGKAVPSGKLTTTWAKRYEDYPSADTFSYLNGNLEKEEYREGIYIGYRYFDTFAVEPLFPFGYGLSYTQFSIEFVGIEIKGTELEVLVSVKNIGMQYAGQEVVQIYAVLPQNNSEKEYKRLIGYEKTKVLKSGEEETLKIRIDQKAFASFSEAEHAWIIEEGNYGIWIGNSSSALQQEAVLFVPASAVIEKTTVLSFEARNFNDFTLKEKRKKSEEADELPSFSFYPQLCEKGKRREYEPLQQETEELIPLLYGNISKTASTLGAAGIKVPGSAGETTDVLFEKYGIPCMILADGPAGIRLQQSYEVDRETNTVYGIGVLGALENGFLGDTKSHENADRYYQFCTAFPVGTALAQTWNRKLVCCFGEAIADEMEEFAIDLWLAPGINIHRNPLCGRNFEYYSEDPLLSGTIAAEVTRGVQRKGTCGVTIKHFVCNNQEDNRMGVDAQVSERALREIYLRGFEIAVNECEPAAIMSSYNLINGVHAANSKDICTKVAREEWGFDGIIMSDWSTTAPEGGSIAWKCIAAGNDIIMPGNEADDENIRTAYQNGQLSENEIRTSAERILRLINKFADAQKNG